MLEVLSSTVDTCQKPLLVFSLPRGVFHQDGTTHELQNPTAQKDPQPVSSPAMSSHTSTPEKPSHSRPCRAAPTCRDEEDAGTEDDVVFALVELAGRHAQASEEQQTHAEDGEDAGCSHCTCGTGSEAGSVPSIAPARRLLASPVPTPVPGKNCCNATLGCCHGAWGRPSTGPRYASLLVPELLCSELALEPSVSPANPTIQASHHKNSLNPEFLFFFCFLGYFFQSCHTVSASNLPSHSQTHHPRVLAADVTLESGIAKPPSSHHAGKERYCQPQGLGTCPLGPQTITAALKVKNLQTNAPQVQQKVIF